MENFNDMDQNLDILAEEYAEVIQMCSKWKRFGLNNYSPLDEKCTPNWKLLEQELGDVLAMISVICAHSPMTLDEIIVSSRNKLIKLEKFYIKRK
jgi:NTP pyrophosphatase (non-canonical NTP hydrolase)